MAECKILFDSPLYELYINGMIKSENSKYVGAEQIRLIFNPPVSIATIRRWQKRRKIPFAKIGGRVIFDVDRVEAHIAKLMS